jgi:hypothetical protein
MSAQRRYVAAHEDLAPISLMVAMEIQDADREQQGRSSDDRLDTLFDGVYETTWFNSSRLARLSQLFARSEQASERGAVRPDEAESLVLEAVQLDLTLAPSTRAKLQKGVALFFKTLRAWDIGSMDEVGSDHVLAFVSGGISSRGHLRGPAPTTQRNRLWVVRSVVMVLYEHECWDGRDLVMDSVKSSVDDPSRALDEMEMNRVRDVSYHWLIPTRRPIVVALSEAGGSSREIGMVTASDLDLEAGSVRFIGEADRINEIPRVALEALRRVFSDGYPLVGRLVTSEALDIERASQSVNTELSRVIREAGLRGSSGAVGKSIRLTAANQILETKGLLEAARYVGADSLDRLAAALRFDWKSQSDR